MQTAELQRQIAAIERDPNLTEPARPVVPVLSQYPTMKAKMLAIQRYINSFEYNYTGRNFFEKKRDRGLRHVTVTARNIMAECFPIQCVEATFLACYLTSSLSDVERLPLSFKSEIEGHVFRHIVLAVRHGDKWGALGISRRASLMYKELKYDSLGDLVREFDRAYSNCWHKLTKIYAGLPLPHDEFSGMPVRWRAIAVDLPEPQTNTAAWERYCKSINDYAKSAHGIVEYFTYTGRLPDDLEAPQTARGGEDEDGGANDAGEEEKKQPSTPAGTRGTPGRKRRSAAANGGGSSAPSAKKGGKKPSGAATRGSQQSSGQTGRRRQNKQTGNGAAAKESGDTTPSRSAATGARKGLMSPIRTPSKPAKGAKPTKAAKSTGQQPNATTTPDANANANANTNTAVADEPSTASPPPQGPDGPEKNAASSPQPPQAPDPGREAEACSTDSEDARNQQEGQEETPSGEADNKADNEAV